MALENALIAKIAGGVVVTGGTVGLGVAFKDNIANWFKSNSYSYLIVKASDATDQPTEANLKHGKDKNYECKIQDVSDAVDCEIIEVKFHDTNKSIDISTLNDLNADKDINKNLFTNATDKYFKLKIDKTKIDLIKTTEDTPKTIDLVLKKPATNENSKKYAKLTPEFQVVDGLASMKSKDLLVAVKVPEAKTGTTESTFTNYQCTTGEVIKTAKACDLFKFSTSGDVGTSLSLNSVNFSQVTTSKITAETDLPKDKIRLLKVASAVTDSKALNKYWKSENIKFASYSSNAENKDKKYWNFTVISRLYGDVANPTKGIFILEK